LTAIDPVDGVIVPLFNPREQDWGEHFVLAGARIIRQTQMGRATEALLGLNDPARLLERQRLIAADRYPPPHYSE